MPEPVLLPEKWLELLLELLPLPELPLPELFSSLPVLSSLLQLIENDSINVNKIRNVLRELFIRRYNSRFALLNVYTVSHFTASTNNLSVYIIIHFLLFVNNLKQKNSLFFI